MSDIQNEIEKSYDELPYVSGAFSASSPLRLEAIGTLLGLTPPSIKTAKILEIGCSYGGNLIPFALAYPDAKILGLDLSGEQIKRGKEIVNEMQLKNLELRQQDICELKPQDVSEYGKFDYIICHGVFSWVPDFVKDAILDVIKQLLSEQGVAYVSYNVYPGWNVKNTLKELIRFAARNETNLVKKVEKAKEALVVFKDFIANKKSDAIPTNVLLTHIDTLLDKIGKNDSYIAHEFLEVINDPIYFQDFIQMLEKRELSYLCESNLDDIFNPELSSDNEIVNAYVKQNSQTRYDEEQFMDFYTHKVFRQSLIVHKDAYQAVATREISPNDIAKLNIVVDFRQDEKGWHDNENTYIDTKYNWLVEVFHRIYPQSTNLAQVVELIEPQNRLNAYMGFINILGNSTSVFSINEQENLGYEVGKTRIKPSVVPVLRYYFNTKHHEIGFANKFNVFYHLSLTDCFIAMRFDGKKLADEIVDDLLKFYKKNDEKIIVKDKELKGKKLRKFAENQVLQAEYLMRECYFFERF